MKVTVTKVPGKSVPVLISDNTSVSDAIQSAGFNTEGVSVRLNNTPITDYGHTVQDGDVILISTQAKGN